MIVESIILAGTIGFVSTLRFVRKVVSDQKKAELQEEKDIQQQESKDRADELKVAQQMADYELLKTDPALCKARLQAIYEKRKIVLYERTEWENDHDSFDGTNWWTEIMKRNNKLDQLAQEEGNIPLLEGVEEFRRSLQVHEIQPNKITPNNKTKIDILERERNLMEGLAVNAAHLSERNSARARIKEISEELSKLS